MPPVLLSKALDPILGVFTGLLAYHLYETNPRTAMAPDQRLTELMRWKWTKWRLEKDLERLRAEEEFTVENEITKI